MQANVIIRMSAAHWDARVRGADGEFITFDFRKMQKRERQMFNRTFVQEFRKAGVKPLRKAA